MTRITSASTYTIGNTYGIRVEIAAALTGTVTIADANGTQAVLPIAHPVGAKEYYGFTGVVTVVNSATEEITVSALNHQG
jgi:hypothetical protein